MAEVVVAPDAFLVSETDEKGIITFANDEFIKISGFTKEELLGKPHNIVRHPDMPKAAFADLWNTVQSGKPWTGFVKNRTKDGGFYWVYATVFPIKGCGKNKSYLSCRKRPSREEIAEAEALYKTLN